jgi:hypothetical protein
MSKIISSNINLRDGVISLNTLGIGYLYYSISGVGKDTNEKILGITKVLRKLISNVNIVDIHLKSHLINHKNNDRELENRIKELEDRILLLEEISNPILKKSNVNNMEKEAKKAKEIEQFGKIEKKGDETQQII